MDQSACLPARLDRLPSFEEKFDILRFMSWNSMQLERMGDGLAPDLTLDGDAALQAFFALESANQRALLDRRGQAAA